MGRETIQRRAAPSLRAAPPRAGPRGLRAYLGDLRGDRAWHASWRAVWTSRLVVWAAGVAAVLAWGRADGWEGFDPGGLTAPFGAVGDLLFAPAARWDAAWYLSIAADGYAGDPARAAFFPLYPLLVRVLGAPAAALGAGPQGALVVGVLLSLAALLVALWVVHRLAELELGAPAAPLTVALIACFPTAWAFSAVYSESLFLALSAGSFYAGRLGRWPLAGLLGGLAAATRSTGLLLLLPLAVLYAHGPRADRPPPAPGRPAWRPRHPLRPDLAWLLLVPAGLAAYLGYLALATGRPLSPFTSGSEWHRELTGPLSGAWEGAVAALAGARQLLSGSREPVFFAAAGGDPFFVAAHNLGDFAFLLFALVATVGVVRRLPAAYGAWALACLAVFLSVPAGPEPLASLPRYLAVVFPLHMWVAAWALGPPGGEGRPHPRRRAVLVLGLSGLLLAGLSAAFATWQWVA